MQCNVPADCWRLQNGGISPQRMHTSPDFSTKSIPGTRCMRQVMLGRRPPTALPRRTRADFFDSRSHVCICCAVATMCVNRSRSTSSWIGKKPPEMARTRSSHQTLKKRLMKQSTPWTMSPKPEARPSLGESAQWGTSGDSSLLARGFQVPAGQV